MKTARTPNAILYLRVSTDRQVNEGNSLDAQDEALRAKAQREGWKVVKVFSDEGFSAHDRDTQRNGIEEAVAYAEKFLSSGDYFGVYNVSRFSRRTSHGSQLRDRLEAIGVVIVDVNMMYDYSPIGNMLFNNMLANAQFFSDNMVRESRLAMERLRKQGRWLGKAPLGYRVSHNRNLPSLIPIPEEREVVVETFKKIMLGVPKHEVARWLAGSDIVQRRFSNVSEKTEVKRIDRMVRMQVYQGVIQTKPNQPPIQGDFEPLVSTDLFQAARLMLGLVPREVRSYSTRLDEFPFKAVILCGQCGAKFTGYYANKTKYGNRYPRYECMGCRQQNISLSAAHEQVVESLHLLGASATDLSVFYMQVEALGREQLARNGEQRTKILDDMQVLEKQRDTYLDAYVCGRIQQEDYERKVVEFNEQKLELQLQMTRISALSERTIETSLKELSRLLVDPRQCWEETPQPLWNELAKVFFPSGLICQDKRLRTRSFLREISLEGQDVAEKTTMALLCDLNTNDAEQILSNVERYRLQRMKWATGA